MFLMWLRFFFFFTVQRTSARSCGKGAYWRELKRRGDMIRIQVKCCTLSRLVVAFEKSFKLERESDSFLFVQCMLAQL